MKLMSQLPAAMLLWIFIACNTKGNAPQLSQLKEKADGVYKSEELNNKPAAADTATPSQPADNKSLVPNGKMPAREHWDKKIVKTGHLTLEVKSYAAFNEMIHGGIKKFGGYIAQEEQSQSDYKIENTVVIKVPVDQFDAAVADLTPGSEKIVEKKISSEDVTAELVDTKSRLEAKKHVRDRYLDMLKQAKNMEEVLQVQQEVNEIQENIEAASGRINYLGHEATFSTINITYYQVLNATGINNPDPSYGYRVLESFKGGIHWFAELFIVLVSLWPLWLGVAALWFTIRKRIKALPVKKTQQA